LFSKRSTINSNIDEQLIRRMLDIKFDCFRTVLIVYKYSSHPTTSDPTLAIRALDNSFLQFAYCRIQPLTGISVRAAMAAMY